MPGAVRHPRGALPGAAGPGAAGGAFSARARGGRGGRHPHHDPRQMDAELIPAFEALKAFNAPFFHYKICSTFDSSPTIGSIGHATELGYRVFDPPAVPMMVGAPFIRRYVVFGNLFARVGDVTYRLDRHPTMSRHPVTPMNESDLRLHLGRQTERKIGLVDIWHMDQGDEAAERWFRQELADGAEIILFDTISDEHMRQIGKIVWGLRGEQPVLLVGSSGFERAIGLHSAHDRRAAAGAGPGRRRRQGRATDRGQRQLCAGHQRADRLRHRARLRRYPAEWAAAGGSVHSRQRARGRGRAGARHPGAGPQRGPLLGARAGGPRDRRHQSAFGAAWPGPAQPGRAPGQPAGPPACG